MRKLYVVMVGLPARGKSTLAQRIKECLVKEGIQAAIFNNGDLRRSMLGAESTEAEFYNPENSFGLLARENIARRNMELAKDYLAGQGDVAIMDATNASRTRRRQIEAYFAEFPTLFIECVNEDPLLLDACIRRKAQLPEYAACSREEALKSFLSRIRYYENIYSPVGEEQYWMRVDAVTNRVIAERPCEHSPYYPAIRDSVVSTWVRCLYLVRHGQTAFNLEGRIGGDPTLTPRGLSQAKSLATHLQGKALSYIFTSTRVRSLQFAEPLLAERPNASTLAMPEFDEIFAGECEGMRYEDIRRDRPEVAEARAADKYAYAYPGGESYADLRERVRRGLMRALFLAADEPLLIVGHQAINRTVLSLFLNQRNEDVPYIYIPQNQYYHLSVTPRKKLFELIKFA
ncbi:MAG: 6-phosphofructo-2-kinase/fructose-2,6-bisphosphatase [Desulfovibrionaceae bacterium]|nr:6-phosphofructo-2-kinase/fructose-2,6-bisphosphatase [Desulfovibrionaceae bacterium]